VTPTSPSPTIIDSEECLTTVEVDKEDSTKNITNSTNAKINPPKKQEPVQEPILIPLKEDNHLMQLPSTENPATQNIRVNSNPLSPKLPKAPLNIESKLADFTSRIKTPKPLSSNLLQSETNLPVNDEARFEALNQLYYQVKIHSFKVTQCCQKLNCITQDARFELLQEFVYNFRQARDCLRRFIDSIGSTPVTLDLRRNGVDMFKYEILMTSEFLLGNGTSQNAIEFKNLVFIN
jgi:hypothetical protein